MSDAPSPSAKLREQADAVRNYDAFTPAELLNRAADRIEALEAARDATIARANRYEAVLRKIAGNIQSGPLWDRHNLEDEMGGVSEPDFEGAYDHFIAICREALEGK